MAIRVLLVSDDDSSRWTLCKYLRGVGLDVQVSRHAGMQVRTMKRRPFDVAIIDMERTAQEAVVSAVRIRHTAHAGIILMMPPKLKRLRLLGLSLGADHCLDKPVNQHEIEIVIRNLHTRWRQWGPAGS